jgi:DNA-binding ferritin-like protein
MEKLLNTLLINLRTTQIIYHQAHNMVSGDDFFGDHTALGGFYTEVEEDYDSVAERTIGLGYTVLLGSIMQAVADEVDGMKFEDSDAVFKNLLGCEMMIRQSIDDLCKNSQISEGTRDLIAGIADSSEVRSYKIGQRCK